MVNCAIGLKYRNQYKVTYGHSDVFFINLSNEGVLFHLCNIVKARTKEELLEMFHHIELEEDEDYCYSEDCLFGESGTDTQNKIEELFKGEDMIASFTDGTVHIMDAQINLNLIPNCYYLDLDEETLMINESGYMYGLPFFFIRSYDRDKIAKALSKIKECHMDLFRLTDEYKSNKKYKAMQISKNWKLRVN
ncbi:hypothetical protein CVD28_02270 [Bacillus sp. M6-12]|uniref:hypothetical protein n=1 Tax=Bacillus sp. M6-12 TaxID=2054166 RepID=UPI000C78B6BC|nr:hypothetical protein [Bacillus sp. M6-12]PLS19258.1 hypothetical protein CVD28_02270 [Bacillus sp. M6-12]